MSRIKLFDHVSGKVKFSHKCGNNSVAKTLLHAVSNGVDLSNVFLCDADLRGVDLCNVDLRGADLRDAYLCSANLSYAYLRGANLRGALLCYANLSGADLRGADLRGALLCNTNLCSADLLTAYLRGALLCYANLSGADLRGADLRGADLHEANLFGADLHGANLNMVRGAYSACPTEGVFIGWKKASGFIVKLLIPDDALRSSAFGTKCRCNKAFVLDIQNVDGSPANVQVALSDFSNMFAYVRNSWVEVKDFDTNRWDECAPGIHFFVDRQEAVDYK